MATPQKHRTRIRLTVDLAPEVHETFRSLAEQSGVGIGRTIGDWLKDTQEAARHVLALVVDARGQPTRAAERLHTYAVGLSLATEGLLSDLRQGRSADSGTATVAASAGSGGGSVAVVTPRPVIRGETSRGKGKR